MGHSAGHCRPTLVSLDPLDFEPRGADVQYQHGVKLQNIQHFAASVVLVHLSAWCKIGLEGIEGGRGGSAVAGGVAQGTPGKS